MMTLKFTYLREMLRAWKAAILLDLTTACVCVEVPDAMLVKAQAASNCNEGLKRDVRKEGRVDSLRNDVMRAIKGSVAIQTQKQIRKYLSVYQKPLILERISKPNLHHTLYYSCILLLLLGIMHLCHQIMLHVHLKPHKHS